MKQVFGGCVCLLAGVWTAAIAQPQPCGALPHEEQMYARAAGTCRDPAPIVDVAPKGARPAILVVPNVAGLSWDEARAQLARFTVRRLYRASEEPGGTVLSQQPAPPARLAAGAIVRLVLSDGTLRPAPAVPASQVDGVRSITISDPASSKVTQSAAPTPSAPADRIDGLQAPAIDRLPVDDARARLGRLQYERQSRHNPAPGDRVIAQTPQASTRIAPDQPVTVAAGRPEPVPAPTETFELPSVVDRSFADASSALLEFKVQRVDVASLAPGGRVLAQDPTPGTQVTAGSAVTLQVSDGSLAAAPAPVATSERRGTERLSNTLLTIGAAIFLAFVLATLLFRQWLAHRQSESTVEAPPKTALVPVTIDTAPERAPEPEIRFAARFDPGDVTIEFSGASDPEQTTKEYSSAAHE